MSPAAAAALCSVALALACGRTLPYERELPPPDAAVPDSGVPDAGVDAGVRDAGTCIRTPLPGISWQFQQSAAPVCFGMVFPSNGNPGEYAFASIPAEDDPFWAPEPTSDISFSGLSRLCSSDGGPPVCPCRGGGDFTYFQTRVDVVHPPRTFRVTIRDVDDGVRVTLFNARHPNGFVGGFALFLSGTTADFAAQTVVGRNRIVLTHVDDCCRDRRIAHASVLVDDQQLEVCP